MAIRHEADGISEGMAFRVWRDGISTEILPDVTVPEIHATVNSHDLFIESRLPWFTVSEGFTGQHGYRGPVMHDSEFISTGMMESILEDNDPTVYMFAVRYPTYDDGEQEGWVILAINYDSYRRQTNVPA